MPSTVLGMTGTEIGARVKQARLAAGLSQEQLAREIGVSVFTVSRLERGTTKSIKVATLYKLCKALNVQPEQIVGNDV